MLKIDGIPGAKALNKAKKSFDRIHGTNEGVANRRAGRASEDYFNGSNGLASNINKKILSKQEREHRVSAIVSALKRYLVAMYDASDLVESKIYQDLLDSERSVFHSRMFAAFCVDERVSELAFGMSPRHMAKRKTRGGETKSDDLHQMAEWWEDLARALEIAREEGRGWIMELLTTHFSGVGLKYGDGHLGCAADNGATGHDPGKGLAFGIGRQSKLARTLSRKQKGIEDASAPKIHAQPVVINTDDDSLYFGLDNLIRIDGALTADAIEAAVGQEQVLSTRMLYDDQTIQVMLKEVIDLSCSYYGVKRSDLSQLSHFEKAHILQAALQLLNRERVESAQEGGSEYKVGLKGDVVGHAKRINTLIEKVCTRAASDELKSDIQQLVWRNLLHMMMEGTVARSEAVEKGLADKTMKMEDAVTVLGHKAKAVVIGEGPDTMALTDPTLLSEIMVCSVDSNTDQDADTARIVTSGADPQIIFFQVIVGKEHGMTNEEGEALIQKMASDFYKSQQGKKIDEFLRFGKLVMFGSLIAEYTRKPVGMFPVFVSRSRK